VSAGAPEAEVLVREAGAPDVELIARWNEAMALETEALRLDPAAARAGAAAVLADPARGRYLIAEAGGAPAGLLLLTYEWSDWRNAAYFWIQSVYVEPARRRRGVFTALFRRAEALAAAAGACGLRLYVQAGNARARAVYARLGLRHHDYLVLETPDLLRRAPGKRQG
jgi:GNAT superfamily N-acetyltransferase